jgi:hypothetical protein
MPRKKTVSSNTNKEVAFEKSQVREAFLDCKTLSEDSVARAVADMVHDQTITAEQGRKIAAVVSVVVSDSVARIMASRGL